MSEVEKRREYTEGKIYQLIAALDHQKIDEFKHTAICVTGSYGRLEASDRSDLDALLLSEDQVPDPSNPEHENVHTRILKGRLGHVDGIRLKAKLIEASRALGLEKFDGDGRYLVDYSSSKLIGMIGRVADDSENTFTTRMLLLLEGRALTNPAILAAGRKAIIDSYWRDYKGVGTLFAPAFMSNDILRMWRTFCVNYEARTATIPFEKRSARRLKNYKLKYSRMLTCYSAILSMLDVFGTHETVTPVAMQDICNLSPCDRISELRKKASRETLSALDGVLGGYEEFLHRTDTTDEALLQALADPSQLKEMLEASYAFADSIFRSITAIGRGSKLHRMVVV